MQIVTHTLNVKNPMIAVLAVLVTSLTLQGAAPETASDPLAAKTDSTGQWHSEPPTDCPFKLSVINQGVFKSSPRPYEGRYPCGSLVHNGVWYYVTYLNHFGQQGYFVNIPSKFISKDGRTMWLCYSANFAAGWSKADIQSRREGSKYAMCLQEIKLLER